MGFDLQIVLPSHSEQNVVADVLSFALLCTPLGCELIQRSGGSQEGNLCHELRKTHL